MMLVLGKLYCEYCGSYSDINEAELNQFESAKESAKQNNYQFQKESLNEFGGSNFGLDNSEASQDMNPDYGVDLNQDNLYDEFHCSSCGAILVTDKTTTITRCVFCGSQQMIKQRLTGRFEPKKVLPFKIAKEQFIKIYKDFVKNRRLAPNEFRNNPLITETRGLYVPFYLYNYDITSYARGEAIYRSDDNTYYKWFEAGVTESALIQIDGSSRLDDSIMASLEPFNLNEMVDFNPVYITGFQAECTDETKESLDMKAENRGVMHSRTAISRFLKNYKHKGGFLVSKLNKLGSPDYVLLPIWFVNTNYKNKKYSYAVNGQTGKVVGEIPLSPIKFRSLMAVLIIIASLLTVGYLSLVFADSYDDDDDSDGGGGVFGLIWGGIVIAPYYGIKKRYKNVKHVFENPIKTWNQRDVKDNTYKNKKAYLELFPDDDLKNLKFQKYVDGQYIGDIDLKNMNQEIKTSLNKNYTINKEEL